MLYERGGFVKISRHVVKKAGLRLICIHCHSFDLLVGLPQYYPHRIHRVKEGILEQAAHLPTCHSGEDRGVVRLVDQETKAGTGELALNLVEYSLSPRSRARTTS